MLRITQKRLFDQLRRSQTKIFGKYFLLIYIENEENQELAVGITVSKKVGNAVVRNRVRRRLKAILQDYTEPPALSRFLVNIIAKPDAAHVEFTQIKDDIYNQFQRLNRYASG